MEKITEFIIETGHLDFGFEKNKPVLQDISLKIEKGSIYGFLGQNGAGKTTTIRLLLGLLTTAKPCIRIFGERIEENPLAIFRKTGAFIESPSLYGHLTGIDNLRISGILRDVPDKRLFELLQLVNLTAARSIKVSRYSLGMKQRLAVALALLSDPELLILDEPTNGLDPVGINETRELLLRLNRERGTTILVSSHMLSEIEKMVTHLGILHKGRMVFQGKITELMDQHKANPVLLLQTNNDKEALTVIGSSFSANQTSRGIEVILSEDQQADQINRVLLNNHISVHQLQMIQPDLEQIYLSITKN